jgi:hypothetical protein
VRDESASGTKKECFFFNGHVLRWTASRFADKCVDRYALPPPAALIHPNGGPRVFHLRKCVPVRLLLGAIYSPWTKIFSLASRRERKVRSVFDN